MQVTFSLCFCLSLERAFASLFFFFFFFPFLSGNVCAPSCLSIQQAGALLPGPLPHDNSNHTPICVVFVTPRISESFAKLPNIVLIFQLEILTCNKRKLTCSKSVARRGQVYRLLTFFAGQAMNWQQSWYCSGTIFMLFFGFVHFQTSEVGVPWGCGVFCQVIKPDYCRVGSAISAVLHAHIWQHFFVHIPLCTASLYAAA